MTVRLETVPSPIGEIALATRDGVVVGANFGGDAAGWAARRFPADEVGIDDGAPSAPAAILAAYFRDPGIDLTAVPLAFEGGSDFETACWRTLLTIPAGRTASYGEIARAVGEPDGAQAVGRAMNANPIPLFAPCHRVIAADGNLTGFGGGLERKRWLLVHERALLI